MEINLNLPHVSCFGVNLPLDPTVLDEYNAWLPENLKSASMVRQHEYLAGRYCVEKAAAKLGHRLSSLPQGPSREPTWPLPLTGSISHSHKLALGCVTLKSNMESIGIDTEEIIEPSRLNDILPLIAVESEMRLLRRTCEGDDLFKGYTILFSAKEALFKALYPLCQTYFDFLEARIASLDFHSSKFTIELISQNTKVLPYAKTYEGSFLSKGQTIITVIPLHR